MDLDSVMCSYSSSGSSSDNNDDDQEEQEEQENIKPDLNIELTNGEHISNGKEKRAVAFLEDKTACKLSHSDIFMSPVACLPIEDKKTCDDSVIKRVNMSTIQDISFSPNQTSCSTTPRRPIKEYHICASNTIIATNGLVYHFEPFQLPPPAEIAALFNELNERSSIEKVAKKIEYKKDYSNSTQNNNNNNHDHNNNQNGNNRELPAEWFHKKEENAPIISNTNPVKKIRCDSLVSLDGEDEIREEEQYFDFTHFDIYKYLMSEMFGSSVPGVEEEAANKSIQNFIKVPIILETLLFFGFFVCLDAFLYMVTFLPLRVFTSLCLLVNEASRRLSHGLIYIDNKLGFHRSNTYDLMRGLLLIFGSLVLSFIEMSRLYHLIRRQTLIKLYVMTGMLEIFDKLLCSFGQDALASLYLQTKTGPHDIITLLQTFFVAVIYVIMHSILYFVHTATLTVAINSNNQAFLTLIVLNNFAEIKSFVFKKFDKQNLFQLSCADITERFQTILFACLIVSVSVIQADAPWHEALPSYSKVITIMFCGECTADWVKHCFITKFNSIESHAYHDYARILRDDILNCHSNTGSVHSLDPTYTVTRRVGLAQLPLACVCIRYIVLALSAPRNWDYLTTLTTTAILTKAFFYFGILVLFKVSLCLCLIFYCGLTKNKEIAARAEERNVDFRKRLLRKKSIGRLANIERYTLIKGRIQG